MNEKDQVDLTEILIKVCPHSQTGRVYTLTQKETKDTADKFELEHVEFLSLLHVLFCQYVLYHVC